MDTTQGIDLDAIEAFIPLDIHQWDEDAAVHLRTLIAEVRRLREAMTEAVEDLANNYYEIPRALDILQEARGINR